MVPCPRRPCDHRNMITLHYHPGNASFTPHVLLHEIGAPFELQLVDRAQGAHKSPAYLALNPNGLIPVLVDGDLVLYETAAIALHLCDTHPAAELAPALGTAERAHFYKWLVWLTNTLQATLLHYFYPERLVRQRRRRDAGACPCPGQGACLPGTDRQATGCERRTLAAGRALQRGGSLCLHAVPLDPRLRRKASAQLSAYRALPAARVLARPAVQRTIAAEQLPEPLV